MDVRVKCYGCGGNYDALIESETQKHTHHLGPVLVSKETVTEWLEQCQRERDYAIRETTNEGT